MKHLLGLDLGTTGVRAMLFDARGAVNQTGSIGCRTCHLTHGRTEAATELTTQPGISARELRARKWHMRTFLEGNVCYSCHGPDALRRFMYFHDAERRGGPIEPGGGAAPAVR